MSVPFSIENIATPEELEMISGMTVTYQDGEDLLVFLPEMRNDQFNALLLLEILYFQSRGGEITEEFIKDSLLDQCVKDINQFMDSFTLVSLLFLKKTWSNLDKEKYKIFKTQYGSAAKLIAFYRDAASGGKKNIIFAETISKYVLLSTSSEIAFDRNTVKYLKEEEVQIFYKGLVIGDRFDLILPLSQVKTQIWKARDTVSNVNRAIKFLPIEMFEDAPGMKAALKAGNFKKIKDIATAANLDFQNRKLLKMLGDDSSGYLMIDFSMQTQHVYIVMEYYDGSLDKIKVKSIQATIMSLLTLLLKFHTSGFCFNNISPAHIVRKSTDIEDKDYREKEREKKRHDDTEAEVFHLIDFSRVSGFYEVVTDYSKSGYASLNIMMGYKSMPYDDVESLLYVAEFLIGGQDIVFPDSKIEKEMKKTLAPFNDRIRDAISKVRAMRQKDEFAVTGEQHPDTEEYVNELYYTEGGFGNIFYELFDGFEEVSTVGVSLHPSEEALVMRIKVDMQSSHLFEALKSSIQIDEMALKIMNHIKYGVEYQTTDQNLINRFLRTPL